jgi:hypothetical protein
MTDANAPNPPAAQQTSVSFSAGYLLTVGAMLLIIIGVLAALWMRERGARARAEEQVGQLSNLLTQNRNAMAQLMIGTAGRQAPSEGVAFRPFEREDHKPVAVTLDGSARQAFVLPASGGRRFGFLPGDVIVVEQESPQTSPAASAASSPSPG